MNYNEEMAELFKEAEAKRGINKLNSEERDIFEARRGFEEKLQAEFKECDRILDRSMRIANAMVAMEKQAKKDGS